MARLTAKQRRGMKKSQFAGPGRSFPMNDPTHDRMAISGATRSFHAGNISRSEMQTIKRKARAKLSRNSGRSNARPSRRRSSIRY